MSKGQYALAVHYGERHRAARAARSGATCVYQHVDEAEFDLLFARALLYVGRIAEGIALLEALIERLEGKQKPDDLTRQGDPLSPEGARWNQVRGRAHNDLGYAYRKYTGELDRAQEEFEKALSYFRASHLDEELANTHHNRGQAYLKQGRHQEAKHWIGKSLASRNEILALTQEWESEAHDERATRTRERAEYRRALSLISLSKVHLAIGQPQEARRLSLEAFQICVRLGVKRGIGLARISLAAAMRQMAPSRNRAREEKELFLAQADDLLNCALEIFRPKAASESRPGQQYICEPIRLIEIYRERGLVYRDWAALAQQSGADPARRKELYDRALHHQWATIRYAGHDNKQFREALDDELAQTASLLAPMDAVERSGQKAERALSNELTVVQNMAPRPLNVRPPALAHRSPQPSV
jgi:tetratricopeptide (TPR) repeat protein